MSPSPSHLVACPGCSRHLRVSEPLCPFCGAAVDAALRARPAPRPPAMRLGRAALFALGAATGTAALASTACSSSSTPRAEVDSGASATESSGETSTHFSASPLYGASAIEHGDAGTSGASSSEPTFSGGPLYGGMASMTEHPDAHDVGADAAYGGPAPEDFSDAGWVPDSAQV